MYLCQSKYVYYDSEVDNRPLEWSVLDGADIKQGAHAYVMPPLAPVPVLYIVIADSANQDENYIEVNIR